MRLRDLIDDKLQMLSDTNTIINGDFDIWQRGEVIQYTCDADRVEIPTADRWLLHTQSIYSLGLIVEQNTDPPPLSFPDSSRSRTSLRLRVNASQTSGLSDRFLMMSYLMEGHHLYPFLYRGATLSFWVRSSHPGTYHVTFRNIDLNKSFCASYTINQQVTWEKKQIYLPFNIDNIGGTWNLFSDVGLAISFVLTAGVDHTSGQNSNQWVDGNYLISNAGQVDFASLSPPDDIFQLSQVKLEPGRVVTSFTPPNYMDELIICQRYYEPVYTTHLACTSSGTSHLWANYYYRTIKRVNPSIEALILRYWNYSPTTGWKTLLDKESDPVIDTGEYMFSSSQKRFDLRMQPSAGGNMPHDTQLFEAKFNLDSELSIY